MPGRPACWRMAALATGARTTPDMRLPARGNRRFIAEGPSTEGSNTWKFGSLCQHQTHEIRERGNDTGKDNRDDADGNDLDDERRDDG